MISCSKRADDILYMVEDLNDFKGGMVENYVNTQLKRNEYTTYDWESSRGAEIDLYKPAYAIKISAKNFGFEDGKKTVPLYAVFCI